MIVPHGDHQHTVEVRFERDALQHHVLVDGVDYLVDLWKFQDQGQTQAEILRQVVEHACPVTPC